MASFLNILGDVVRGVGSFLDPTPGDLLVRAGSRLLPSSGSRPSLLPPSIADDPRLDPDAGGPMLAPAGLDSCSQSATALVAQPMATQRLMAPRGMVIVECPRGSGQKVAMERNFARANGFWRPARKPPISASEWRTLKVAERVSKKVDRVVKARNEVVGKRRLVLQPTTSGRR